MKWTILINQAQAIELGMKMQEAIILGMICDAPSWAEPVIFKGEVFYWTSRKMISSELPLLGLKEDTIYRALRALDALGLIEYRKIGAKDCTRLTNRGKSYLGKKSEQIENSEKNPSKLGKKSEKNTEKNPTYPRTSIYPETNHPLPDEDEELLIEIDPYSEIPNEGIAGLSRDSIIGGVEDMVASRASDSKSYRETLIREIAGGGNRTITNIRRLLSPSKINPNLPRTGANRGVPLLPPGINIFDVIGRD